MNGERQGELEDMVPLDPAVWNPWRGQTETRLAGLETDVDKITEILADIGPTGKLHWDNLAPGRRALLMEALAGFVEFLDRTYLISTATFALKPCWWRHPDVVWQLTALMVAFQAAYRAASQPSQTQVAFHEQALWPVVIRLKNNGSMGSCKQGQHHEPTAETMPVDPALAAQIENWRNGDEASLDDFSKDTFDVGAFAAAHTGGQLQSELPGTGATEPSSVGIGVDSDLPPTTNGYIPTAEHTLTDPMVHLRDSSRGPVG